MLAVIAGACVFFTIAFIFFFIGIYNTLIKYRNETKNAFGQIDVQLRRRYDLIPNLVETAKKFLSHEKETLEAVIRARNTAIAASDHYQQNPQDHSALKEMLATQSALSNGVGQIFALNERYPELKSEKTVSELMEELRSTENRIAYSRQYYNDSVTVYNNSREMFPQNIITALFNFGAADLWELEDKKAIKPVKVDFS